MHQGVVSRSHQRETAYRYHNTPTSETKNIALRSTVVYVLHAASSSTTSALPLISVTHTADTAPMSRQEKIALGDGMRRLIQEEGVDNRVEVPSSRGPSSTWRREIRPRVDNSNCSPETLRLRAKTMESERNWQSTISNNTDEENKESVERLRVAELKRQPEEYISAMKEAGLSVDHKLSAHETVQLQTVLKAPTRSMRILRSFLQQHGINIFIVYVLRTYWQTIGATTIRRRENVTIHEVILIIVSNTTSLNGVSVAKSKRKIVSTALIRR